MGCGGSTIKKDALAKGAEGAGAKIGAMGVKMPEIPKVPDMTEMDPQVLAVTAATHGLTELPQWNKMAEGGFNQADKDGSGSIDAKELEVVMEKIQEGVLGDLFPNQEAKDVDSETVKEAMKKYNKDNDSTLSKEEFCGFATEYIRITVKKSAITAKKNGEDLTAVLEKIGERTQALSAM